MDLERYRALTLRDTDVQGVMKRLGGGEELYAMCLRDFLEDDTARELNRCIAAKLWDDAFTAAHSLKGVAGNMGFVPLMHAAGRVVMLIRGGRVNELPEAMEQVNSAYRDIVDAIGQHFAHNAQDAKEGEAK